MNILQVVRLNAENNIREAACVLEDKEMEVLIAGVDFVAKEVKYRSTCKNAYIKKKSRKTEEGERVHRLWKDQTGTPGSFLQNLTLYSK